jgi:hypothetical protein
MRLSAKLAKVKKIPVFYEAAKTDFVFLSYFPQPGYIGFYERTAAPCGSFIYFIGLYNDTP